MNANPARRLDERRTDPLKALKVSDLDAVAQAKWKDYSKARDTMLIATSTAGRSSSERSGLIRYPITPACFARASAAW